MPGGFVPYHHSTGKKYKTKSPVASVTSGVTSVTSGVSKGGSNVYGGSPSSYGYVAPSSSSSSSSQAQAVAAAEAAQAAAKIAKAVVSEFGKSTKKPKTVSGKYAKASEKAKKKRAKSKKAVEKKTAEVKKKYETKRVTIKPITQKAEPVKPKMLDTYDKELKQAKWKPAQTGKAIARVGKAASTAGKRHYFEDGSWTTTKKYERDYALPDHPRRAAQRRSDTLYAKTGLPGKAPKVKPAKHSQTTNAGNPAGAWVPHYGNEIRFAPPLWGSLTGSRSAYNDQAKATLLHEFAHTKQSPKTQKSGNSEGLATRYAARMGRELGIPPSATPEYRGYKKAAPAAPKTVMKRQFVNGKKQHKYQGTQSPEEYLSSQKAPAPKYLDTPRFGPGNAYKVWEGSNQIAAKAKELSKGKTGRAETEATRNAARAAEALSRAVTAKGAGPKPRKVANRLERAVRRAGPDTSVYKDLGPVAPQLAEAAVKYGKEFGIDPSFLMAIAEVETGFGAAAGSGTPGAGAVSSAGAQGYMQFMPESRDTVLRETGYDAFSNDPKEAMAAAAAYFSVFAPDAQSNYDRAFSYNHADWYANDVVNRAKKYTALDNAEVSNVPTQIKRTARQTLGKRPTKAILQGGKVVRDPDAEGTGPVQVDSARDQVRAGAIQKPSPKEDKYFSYDHETDRAWFDPILQKQLIALAKASGEPIQLNSGFRTLAEQKAAYADYQAGGALAATPGSSNHEFGLAADLQLTDKQRSMLGEFGLGLPVPGEDWHVEVMDPKLKAQQSAVNLGTAGGSATVTGDSPNIPIQGTNLAVKVPLPTTTGTPSTGGTTYSGGTSSTGAPVPGTPEYQQMMNEVRRRRGPSVAKRLAKIDRWMTSPLTAETPEISQELIDRILGK